MTTFLTRLARPTVASALVRGLGALGAGPALANGSSWSGSIRDSTMSADDAPVPTTIGRGSGVK